MSDENKKVIDGVIVLSEFDVNSLPTPPADKTYLYVEDDGIGNTILRTKNSSGEEKELVTDEAIAQIEADTVAANSTITAAGVYSGNGSAQDINLGFSPDVVFVGGDALLATSLHTRGSMWYDRTAAMDDTHSFGEAIALTTTGFSVGSDAKVNSSGVNFYYFAIKDNDSNTLLLSSYQGNAIAGRAVSITEGHDLLGVMIKRDSARSPVFALKGGPTVNYQGSLVTTATLSPLGALSVNADPSTNEWTGNLGEGIGVMGLVGSGDAAIIRYNGNGASMKIPTPFAPVAAIILPLGNPSTQAQFWCDSMPSGFCKPLGPFDLRNYAGPAGGNYFTVLSNLAVLNKSYALILFKKNSEVNVSPARRSRLIRGGFVSLPSGGYMDCGADDSLVINGALSLEYVGSSLHYTVSTAAMTGGSSVNEIEGNQSWFIRRSSGLDAIDGNMSWGLGLTNPFVDGKATGLGVPWIGQSLLIPTSPLHKLPATAGQNYTDLPMQCGNPVLSDGKVHHYMITHDGSGWWTAYVDGQIVKERKLDLSTRADPPRANIASSSGHKTIIGAAQTDIVRHALGGVFKLARVYDRQLSKAEITTNYKHALGYAGFNVTADFVEEWDADNATSTKVLATVNVANDANYTGGAFWVKP